MAINDIIFGIRKSIQHKDGKDREVKKGDKMVLVLNGEVVKEFIASPVTVEYFDSKNKKIKKINK